MLDLDAVYWILDSGYWIVSEILKSFKKLEIYLVSRIIYIAFS